MRCKSHSPSNWSHLSLYLASTRTGVFLPATNLKWLRWRVCHVPPSYTFRVKCERAVNKLSHRPHPLHRRRRPNWCWWICSLQRTNTLQHYSLTWVGKMLVGKKRTILGNCRWRISPEGCLRFHSGTRPSSKRTSNHLHVISAPLERKILPHGSATLAPASHHSSSDGTFTPLMMAEELLPFLRCFHNPGKRFNLDLIVLRKGSFWAINERPNSSSRSPK